MFKARFIDPILAGTKTTTIRPAAKVRAVWGDVVALRCRYDQPAFAHARVLDVAPLNPATLTVEQAAADGFDDVADLQALIGTLYPDEPVVVVTFVLVDAPEPPNTLL